VAGFQPLPRGWRSAGRRSKPSPQSHPRHLL